jgi:hypothetical protein
MNNFNFLNIWGRRGMLNIPVTGAGGVSVGAVAIKPHDEA